MRTLVANSNALAVGSRLILTGGGYTPYVVGVAASGELQSDDLGNPSDGDTVTIGSVEYTFKSSLSVGPAIPNEIKIDVSYDVTLANLGGAIDALEGYTYSDGTVEHPDVEAAGVSVTHSLPLTAREIGVAGNSIATVSAADHFTFANGTLLGGIDASIADEVEIQILGKTEVRISVVPDPSGDITTEALEYHVESPGVVQCLARIGGTVVASTSIRVFQGD